MSIFDEENTKEVEEKVPSCLSLFSEWRDCSSSRNQFRHYYIYGQFSNCQAVQDNWSNCIAWKMKRSKEARDSILRNLRQARVEKKIQHTANIWQFRPDPAKDWNE